MQRSYSTNQPYPDHSPSTADYKASYDDLIDEYSSPYAPNSKHQTFNFQTSPTEHRRGPSFPLSKASIRTSEETAADVLPLPNTYPPISSKKEKDIDARGLWQKIVPESLACRLYILTVLIETTIDLAIEGEIFARIQAAGVGKNPVSDQTAMDARKMPVYLSIFALAHVFQFILAVDAVSARNTLQFIALAVFNAVFVAYSIIQISEIRSLVNDLQGLSDAGSSTVPIDVLAKILPVVISLAEVAYIALGWRIYNEFGWKVYKFLGADIQIKKMYAKYQIFQCLVKFDVFFWVGFSVQFIALVLTEKSDWEYYITCAAVPVSLILLVEGHLAARHENKWMMATFMSGCVGAMIYFIYKLQKVVKNQNSSQFSSIHVSLVTFSVIAIVLLLITFVYAVMVMRNFGRGLKESFDRNASNAPTQRQEPHRRANSKTLNRMSIE